jgi:hypothetical protein
MSRQCGVFPIAILLSALIHLVQEFVLWSLGVIWPAEFDPRCATICVYDTSASAGQCVLAEHTGT